MAAKSKKSAAAAPDKSASASTSTTNKYKDHRAPAPVATAAPPAAAVAPYEPNQRSGQPFSGGGPPHQLPSTHNVTSPQSAHSSYPISNIYNPTPTLQSPFLGNQSQFPHQQQPPDSGYYQSNTGVRSQQSPGGPYYSTGEEARDHEWRPVSLTYLDKPDSMAAAATMQRPYPPIYNNPPSSNSPASVTSPQTQDHHGRPLYGQPNPQLAQPMYGYPQYGSMSHVPPSGYGQHTPSTQTHQMSPPMMQYQSSTPQMPQGQMSAHHSTVASSPRLKSDNSQQYQPSAQQRSGMVPQPHQTTTPVQSNASLQSAQQAGPVSSSNAAPGPIPATTPLVVKQDSDGVQWIAFEYSRDRVKTEYYIRCDVESVDTNSLSEEFKTENCVYPRACVPKEQYKGNRLAYETDCNQVGWALAQLNTTLRGKRGLIQRAVDSWRNSNADPRLRSRRVRRQAKITTRNRMGTSTSAQGPPPGPPLTGGLPSSNQVVAPNSRPTANNPTSMHHHHSQHDMGAGPDNVGAYPNAPSQYRPSSTSQHMSSPTDLRQSQMFPGYQAYPNVPTTLGPSMAPPIPGTLHHLGRPGGPAAMGARAREDTDMEDSILFGDVPEGKRRKFILVEDTQKNARVRVKVTLDQIDMSEIPDSYRKNNSVFPRAYYPVQMQVTPETDRNDRFMEEGAEVGVNPGATFGRKSVPVETVNGEAEIDVPQISRSKQGREQKLNELGYRMAWGQGRVFSGRPIFLARALDAYRDKQRGALIAAGQEASAIPDHLVTRMGKRQWQARFSTSGHAPTPTPSGPADADKT